MKYYDSIIIGSGVNSLVAATILGKKGEKVLVLESRNEIGGLSSKLKFIDFKVSDINRFSIDNIANDHSLVMLSQSKDRFDIINQKKLFRKLLDNKCKIPIILSSFYDKSLEDLKIQLYSTIDLGSLLIEGFGDGIFIKNQNPDNRKCINSTSFGLLQASRRRISKAEYISCPSCGRTLFDLEDTTAMIRSMTGHLKGVKIGIMGCIVNGPGESKHANIGISLPGNNEDPSAPVFIDGKKYKTLHGENIKDQFIDILQSYIEENYR